MKSKLVIRGSLNHDGDGLVRLYIAAENECFEGKTAVWANETEPHELGVILEGFPSGATTDVEYVFGSPKSGECRLRFTAIDRVGHCAAWVHLISEDEPYPGAEFESSRLCVRFTAAAIDRFCQELRKFKQGLNNEAILGEDAL